MLDGDEVVFIDYWFCFLWIGGELGVVVVNLVGDVEGEFVDVVE